MPDQLQQPLADEVQPLIAKWQLVTDQDGPSPRSRHGHRAVSIKELIIVYGGGNEGIFDDLYVYNTTTCLWYKSNIRGENPPGLAAFGMCCDGEKVFIFGGMKDQNRYSNELYELDTRRWEYKQIKTRALRGGPSPRFGHSFNIDSESYGYVFGGYTNEHTEDGQQYLNDFYRIKLDSSLGLVHWEPLPIENGPPARESHTGVIYEKDGIKQLIIYGGMNGERLSDIWIFDLQTMKWQKVEQHGTAPLGRSLHSANLIQDRMYIFGGWVSAQGEEVTSISGQPAKLQWKCSNDLSCFNLKTLTWESFDQSLCDNVEQMPKARAGHCSAVVRDRIYVWSGREGVRRIANSQICCNDILFLETSKPEAPEHLHLVRATMNGVEIQWTASPTANEYLLQIYKVNSVEIEQASNPPLPNILQSRGARSFRTQNQQAGQNGQVTRFYLTPQNNSIVRMVTPHQNNNPVAATSGQKQANSSIPMAPYQPQQPMVHKMPNNILEEDSFHDSLEETAASTSNNSSARLVDPSSISLSEPSTPVLSETNTTVASSINASSMNASSTNNNITVLPADPEPTLHEESNQRTVSLDIDVPAEPNAAETSERALDIPADPQNTSGDVNMDNQQEVPQPPLSNGQVVQQEETWHDVGIIKKTFCLVTRYFIDNTPNEEERRWTTLEPGTQYKFRVAAINSCGQSDWSPEASFRTCIPGYPGAPSSIKITKGQDCARLNWAPPSIPNGTICEYSVYLAMRTSDAGSPFLRVYAGEDPFCTVSTKTLSLALIDNTPKPAVIFRIAARNEKGYGPATQVRWLQDNRNTMTRPGSVQPLNAQDGPYNKRIRLD